MCAWCTDHLCIIVHYRMLLESVTAPLSTAIHELMFKFVELTMKCKLDQRLIVECIQVVLVLLRIIPVDCILLFSILNRRFLQKRRQRQFRNLANI